MSDQPIPHPLTEREFSKAIGVSISTVRSLRRAGVIPHVRVGRRVLYTRDDVAEFFNAHRRGVSG